MRDGQPPVICPSLTQPISYTSILRHSDIVLLPSVGRDLNQPLHMQVYKCHKGKRYEATLLSWELWL